MTWWSGNALLDGSWQQSADGAVRNQLTLGPLSRADLGAEYTCWATNHVLSPPRSTTFSVDLLREWPAEGKIGPVWGGKWSGLSSVIDSDYILPFLFLMR